MNELLDHGAPINRYLDLLISNEVLKNNKIKDIKFDWDNSNWQLIRVSGNL